MSVNANSRPLTYLVGGVALFALTACGDTDFRRFGATGFDTSSAAQQPSVKRPTPDSRGIISYPNYQVAVARNGDTVTAVANRIGMNPAELARYNALTVNDRLNGGEVLALPKRVEEPMTSATQAPLDITAIASSAIDRASPVQNTGAAQTTVTSPRPVVQPAASEPVRHQVRRGETAYSIARYYSISPKALAEWNGLSGDMNVREGQYLLIPPATGSGALAAVTAPGQGSPTPTPPSAAQPLPDGVPPIAASPVDTSAAPNLGANRSSAAQSQLLMPVSGSIARPYAAGRNEGIDIQATAGATVKAAEAGTVAAITKDTDQVSIIVIRHTNGLLTVYANVDNITVQKGATVTRGQNIARVRTGGDNTLHFEVRKGMSSVDPVPYL